MRGYSESNRAPTPLELGCADPNKPCLLEGFLVSDPPLQQVVAKTYEAGLRGNGTLGDGKVEWKARPVPHRQPERHHQRREPDPGPRRVPERRRDAPAGPRSRRRIPQRAVAGLCQLQLHRRDLSVQRPARVAQQSDGRRQRQHPGHAGRPHPRHPAAPVQGRRRLCRDAGMESRGRFRRGRQPVFRR